MTKQYLQSILKQPQHIKKIQGEASNRAFYRVYFPNHSLVAMVYPTPNPLEIEKITTLTHLYLQHRIPVPSITGIIDNRVILLQDLGDLSLQKAFARSPKPEREKLLETISHHLIALKGISTTHTSACLGTSRLEWEMDFFLTHFAPHYLTPYLNAPADSPPITQFREQLHTMVRRLGPIDTFAHRDFHSRNMLVHQGTVYLVDFQDSLVASPWYDLASIAFDCYLDLKNQRASLIHRLKVNGLDIQKEQLYITALQRNIKALGTFGYQVTQKNNLTYKKYINRTLRHILSNPLLAEFFHSSQFQLAGS